MPESPLSPTAVRQTPASSLLTHAGNIAGETLANGDSCGGVSRGKCQSLHHKQVFLSMMAPKQMQQLLSPNQLQALIQQKQQALLIQQQHLKEFYKKQQQHIHLQLLQHQTPKKSKDIAGQQLVLQQLLHLHQQQLFQLQRPIISHPAGVSSAELQQIWKELTKGAAEDKPPAGEDPAANGARPPGVTARSSRDRRSPSPRRAERAVKSERAATHTLFSHGVCNWPGCESLCENVSQFKKHMVSEHTLDDRSTAQCRVQMQVVHQLELQLCKERERLRAMMAHLYQPASETPLPPSPAAAADPHGLQLAHSLPPLNPSEFSRESPVSSPSQGGEEEVTPRASCAGALRRHHQHALVYSLSSDNEYELYKNTDIRPPFTYATLIRQAIMESSDMQLTLNEIYNWFTRTFAYFRRNAATWKNAVRHNLSLHKCFVRVENMKGAVWTVDEVEYQRRRSQKITGTQSLLKSVSPGLASGAVLSATLQSALADVSLPGFKIESRGTGEISESSAQAQESPLFKDKGASLSDRESPMSTANSAGLQMDMNESEVEHLFDL